MESKKTFIAGVLITLLGIGMLLWGVHMFTYRGDFTELMSITGEYSFLFCIPVFLIGVVLTIIGLVKR
ncbi:hypothetical protein GCM10007422_05460 [Pedobacter zeae]|uniref:DUF3098 domain-containing protein n=1 Tax=Pedobacter zeae TaxID=1737356 RepID=A0ABQ1XJ13_9SPHI|nr:hypothetical protein GCM10007422_05460 [Pedobacter zeae]